MKYGIGQVLYLLVDVPFPDSGPPVKAGCEVIVISQESDGYVVESVESWPDSGNGEEEEAPEFATFRVSQENVSLLRPTP